MTIVGNILVSLGSVVIGCIALIAVARGCNETKLLLAEADEHDIVIDAMAWIDRKVWGAGTPKKASRPASPKSDAGYTG
jgi:hypothetical protein